MPNAWMPETVCSTSYIVFVRAHTTQESSGLLIYTQWLRVAVSGHLNRIVALAGPVYGKSKRSNVADVKIREGVVDCLQ